MFLDIDFNLFVTFLFLFIKPVIQQIINFIFHIFDFLIWKYEKYNSRAKKPSGSAGESSSFSSSTASNHQPFNELSTLPRSVYK